MFLYFCSLSSFTVSMKSVFGSSVNIRRWICYCRNIRPLLLSTDVWATGLLATHIWATFFEMDNWATRVGRLGDKPRDWSKKGITKYRINRVDRIITSAYAGPLAKRHSTAVRHATNYRQVAGDAGVRTVGADVLFECPRSRPSR